MAVHKTELVAKIAETTGMTKKKSAEVLDATFEAIRDFLEQGENVQYVGFGNFKVVERAPRVGRNLQTGEVIHIPATKVPVFKAGKSLKEAVK